MHSSRTLITIAGLVLTALLQASTETVKSSERNGSVLEVVSRTYHKIVLDESKDVLLLYYNPSCGPCHFFAPFYEQVGVLFENETDNLVVAQINVADNELPEEVLAYPQVKLFKAGNKSSPIAWGGKTELEDVAEWLRDHTSHHLDYSKDKARLEAGMDAYKARRTRISDAIQAARAEKAKVDLVDQGVAISNEESLPHHEEL